jgi:restriction endonuclease Mrr
MAPWTSKDAAAQPHEPGLTDLLTLGERSELTLLIANITEVMRKHIEDIFEVTVPLTKEPAQVLQVKEKNVNTDETKGNKGLSAEEKAKQLTEKDAKELPDEKLQDLKKAALEFFHQWQEEVVKRIGEVVNSKETAEAQKEEVVLNATSDSTPPPDSKVVVSKLMVHWVHCSLF